MASLVDTNILVYRFDPRDPVKQQRAAELLEAGIAGREVVLAHQSIVEFVAAVTRPQHNLGGKPLLPQVDAILEAEDLLAQFPVIYPGRDQLVTALRGSAVYGLSWFDAQIWACAEVNGLAEILSEDFQHGRHYGRVRAVNPFVGDGVRELPALYASAQVPQRAGGSGRA